MVVLTEDRRNLNKTEKALLNTILALPEKKFKRIVQLVQLAQQSTDDQEIKEIRDVLVEILFGDPVSSKATPIEDEHSPDGGAALARDRKYVGQQIRDRRVKLGMTQEQLAKRSGLRQGHICRLELGQHAPSYLTMQKLAGALGVQASQLHPGFDE